MEEKNTPSLKGGKRKLKTQVEIENKTKKKKNEKEDNLGENFEKDLEKNKKITIGLIILAVSVVAISAGFFMWKSKHENTPEAQSPKDLISQYRGQLEELKKKAKGDNLQDIQNYAVAQYATGDAQGAEQTYRRQIEKGGDSAMIRNNLGNALRDQKKFDEAIKEYEEAIKKDKALISAYLNLGSIYQYSLQNPAKAVDVYKQGIENNPKMVDLQIFLAQAYEQIKDVKGAKNTYRAVLEIQSENAAAKAGLKRLGEE